MGIYILKMRILSQSRYLVFMILLTAGNVQAQEQDIDRVLPVLLGTDRVVGIVQNEASPYRPIGYAVAWRQKNTGTAFLVAPCYAATALHLLTEGDGRPFDDTQKIDLYFGNGSIGPGKDQAFFQYHAIGTPVQWGQAPADPSSPYRAGLHRPLAPQEGGPQDWLLLHIDPCLGEAKYDLGYFKLKILPSAQLLASPAPIPVQIAGYPFDRSLDSVSVDRDCHLLGPIQTPIWQSDCQVRSGFSGAPILTFDSQTQEMRVVAMAVAGGNELRKMSTNQTFLYYPTDHPLYYNNTANLVPVASIGEAMAFHDEIGRKEEEALQDPIARVKILTTSLARHPKAAILWFKRGLIQWIGMNRFEDAASDFRTALTLNAKDAAVQYSLARVLSESDRRSEKREAIDLLEDLDQRFPETPQFSFYLTKTYIRISACERGWKTWDNLARFGPEVMVDYLAQELSAAGCAK